MKINKNFFLNMNTWLWILILNKNKSVWIQNIIHSSMATARAII